MLEGGYFDVDSFLAEDTLVPVTCLEQISDLGRVFDPGSNGKDLKSGNRLELPLWLGKELVDEQTVNFRKPPAFGKQMQQKIHAGAEVVNLKKRCPSYYTVAMQLAVSSRDDSLADFTLFAFQERYMALLTNALCTTETRTTAVKHLLSEEERELYDSGYETAERFESWRRTGRSFVKINGNVAANGGASIGSMSQQEDAPRNTRQRMSLDPDSQD